jgi:outer membrane protein assembly factor BamB
MPPAALRAVGLFVVAILALPQSFASAQIMIRNGVVVTGESADERPNGFSLKKEDPAVVDAYADFERYSDKQDWAKAFHSLDTVLQSAPKGMVPVADGFMVPSRKRVMAGLLALPSDGRSAYRLFYDAKAKQLWETAQRGEKGGASDEITTLQKIVDQYFVSSYGDLAADRLGDALFEAGDFTGAARAWQLVIDGNGDTTLSKLRLHTKRAAALARGGHWPAFEQESRLIRDSFAGQTVTIGGKEWSVADYVESLRSSTATSQPTLATTSPATEPAEPIAGTDPASGGTVTVDGAVIHLPSATTPTWQCPFVTPAAAESMRTAAQQVGWPDPGYANAIPASCTDGKRIFLCWMGIDFGIDARTGKLLWRTGKLSDVTEKAAMMVEWCVQPSRFAITSVGDRVLVVQIMLERINYQEPFRLMCLDAATGKVKWNSSMALDEWGFVGKPLMVGNTVYALVHPRATQETSLLALNLENGTQQWIVSLGTPAVNTNWRGLPDYPMPVLLYRAGMIYVMTNNGALIALNESTRSVEWAFTYPTRPAGQQQFVSSDMVMPTEITGTAVIRDDLMYIKETSMNMLYALDLTGPSLKWKRPVDDNATIAKVDDDAIYLVGRELSAIDLKTRAMRWGTSVPTVAGSMRPVFTSGNRVYVLSSRGVFELDSTTGDPLRIFRGADRDSLGGDLWQASGKLIGVSNLAVTAYTPESR